MAKQAIKIREETAFTEGQGVAAAEKAQKVAANARRKQAVDTAMADFSGKVFADLTPPEKDDLLKALAIQAGIIEE